MRDSNEKKRKPKRSTGDGSDDSLDALLASYTPRQREKVRNGLRILARVAIRSFMEEEAGRSRDENEGEEGQRDGPDDECEQQRGV